MDTAALVFFVIAVIALTDIGTISAPLVLARKGYNPRRGLYIGAAVGLVCGIVGLFVLKPLLYIPLQASESVVASVLDQEHEIIDAQWNEDGSRLVAWTEEDNIRIWSLTAINSPDNYGYTGDSLHNVAWSPNERQFLAWGESSEIELWATVDDEQPRYIMEHDGRVIDAMWVESDESARVLTWTDNNSIYVWNTDVNLDLPLVLRSEDELITAVWDSEDERILAWYADDTVRVWNTVEPAAGQRVSTTDEALQRLPFLALEVDHNLPADNAGLRTGDRVIRINEASFVLDQLLLENDINAAELSVQDVNRALSDTLEARLVAQFEELQAASADVMEVEVLRNGETITADVRIPLPSSPADIIEFADLGFELVYVPENPRVLSIGQFESDVFHPPWSPERDLILTWAQDDAVQVYDVTELQTPVLSLPYSSNVDIQGAIWGDNNDEIVLWTADDAFAWNLDDDNAGNRSIVSNSPASDAGMLIEIEDDSAAAMAGLQSGDVLRSVEGTPIDVATIIETNGITGEDTRDFDRAITPIVIDILARSLTQATLNGDATVSLEILRNNETQTIDVAVPETPALFPSLALPLINIESFGVELSYISQNPRRLPIEASVVNAAVSSENNYIALLTVDSGLTLWSLQTDGDPINLSEFTNASWNEEGTHLLVWADEGTQVQVFDTADISNPEVLDVGRSISTIEWSPNSEMFFIEKENRELTVWNINDLTVEEQDIQPDSSILETIWSPEADAAQILTYLDNGTLTIWSLVEDSENITTDVNSEVTFADDINFSYSIDFDNDTGILPLRFDLSGARTPELEFVRALMAGLVTYFGGLLLLKLVWRLLPARVGTSDNEVGNAPDMRQNTIARGIRGRVIQYHYSIAIVVGIVALSSLMWNVIKDTFTLSAVSNTVDPMTLTDDRPLSELDAEELSLILSDEVRARRLRTLIQENVWGVDNAVAAEVQYDRLSETSLGDLIPGGDRISDDIEFQNLNEHPTVMRDLLTFNVEPEILHRLAAISEMDRDDLADMLLSITTPERQVEIITEQNFWGDLTNPDVQPYEPEALAGGLNLQQLPPEGITYDTLAEYPAVLEDALRSEGQGNLSRGAFEDVLMAELDRLVSAERSELVTLLLDTISANQARDILIELEILFEPEETDGFVFTPDVLQERLALETAPSEGVLYDEIGENRELMAAAYGNEALIATLLFHNIVLEQVYDFDTSDYREDNIRSLTAPVGTPQSILNRNVAEIIISSEFHTPDRNREIVRIYAWGADLQTVRDVSSEPLMEVSDMVNPPQVPDDLNFNSISESPEAARYILLENLNRTDIETLVIAEVVQPRVVATWSLDQLIIRELGLSNSIDEELEIINEEGRERAEQDDSLVWNDAELEFRSWLTLNFLRRTLSANAEITGMRNAILGTAFVIFITILVAFPIGIGAAIYLEEYADKSMINRIIQTNIDNLAGVPSIIYGLLGVALFVRALEPLTSGQIFGYSDELTANGRTILSASLTMALLILPIIIINSQEAIRAVSQSIRNASYGLGATQWQTIWNHVLPYSIPGILTGTILAMSRAIGETAPLIVVGAATFIVQDPDGPFSKFTALPIQIYSWTGQPRDADKAVAAAAIIVLLAILLTLNSIAVFFRNRAEIRTRS